MPNDNGESDVSPTESQTTRTIGNNPRGNWKIPETSLSLEMDRSEKVRCRYADMHVSGKSHRLVVPQKQVNNSGALGEESVDGRSLTKENALQSLLDRTQSRNAKSRGLLGVRATPLHPAVKLAVIIQGRSRMR